MANKKKEQEMDNWISYLIGTGLALGLADFCTKLAAGKISNGLGFLIFGICTFTISSVALFLFLCLSDWKKSSEERMINHFQQLITNTLGKIHLKIFCPFWFIYNMR